MSIGASNRLKTSQFIIKFNIGVPLLFLLITFVQPSSAQGLSDNVKSAFEPTVRKSITPVKIIWQTDNTESKIINVAHLLKKGPGQADLTANNLCVLTSKGGSQPGILLDFGKEIQGSLRLITGMWKSHKPVHIRVRFGESASEAMSEIADTVKDATNDHAIRDFIVALPWLGRLEVGNSGFRFVRIDLVDQDAEVDLNEVDAISIYRNIPYLGSFKCSDTLLNKIWETGAYTVQLNMQDYLWDGIKRDRLVWVGDMDPETSTINAVFGSNEVVTKSLDFARNTTPLPGWMDGISSYSMWWIIIQHDLYMHNGNLAYLKEQKTYLEALLNQLSTKIDSNNSEILDGKFLDWPSSTNPKAIHAGLQAMMVITFKAGAELCSMLGDAAMTGKCNETIARLKKNIPDANNSKQAAALLALSGLISPKSADQILAKDGAKNFSTFYGYYMLQAMAKAGNYQGALDDIRNYWGAMIKLGATTFWEDFNLDWLPNASPIDNLVQPGKKDIHADYGAYCYKGYRMSLCHGWASGPTPWLTEYVLGVKVLKPGCKVVKIEPHLGDLSFAEGTYPTPYGVIRIKHVKLADGKIKSQISGPKEVQIVH